MASCFCFGFGRRASSRRERSRGGKRLPQKLPPEVAGRIQVAVATTVNESAYSLAQKGQTAELKRLLERASREHINRWLSWVDESNRTPLIIAAKEGHTDCMQILIEKGSDVMHMSHGRDEGSALHIVVRKKLSTRIIYTLLARGANPFVENNFHITAWDVARQQSNWTAISIFNELGLFRRTVPIQVGGDDCTTSMREVCVLPRYEWQWTSQPLRRIGRTLYICSLGPAEDHSIVDLAGAQAEWIAEETTDIASILLTFPAAKARLAKDLSTRMQTSSSVMHIWIPKWSSWTLTELIEVVNQDDEQRFGSDPRGSVSDDVDTRIMDWIRQQTASQFTEEFDHVSPDVQLPDEVCRYAKDGDYSALVIALESLSKSEKARALCWEDVNGNTALMSATEQGHLECVKLLLLHGANVYHSNRKQGTGTALHIAISKSLPREFTQALLAHHANPLVETSSRITAADLCSGDKGLMTCEELLFRQVSKGTVKIEGKAKCLVEEKELLIFVAPRYACCDRLQDLRRIGKTMHIYEAGCDQPLLQCDLFEAKAELSSVRSTDQESISLTIPYDSILTWSGSESALALESERLQLSLSFGMGKEACSRLLKIIRMEDGLGLTPSVKNLWKGIRRINESSALLFAARQHMSSFSLSTTPSVDIKAERDVDAYSETEKQTINTAQNNTACSSFSEGC